MKDYSQDTLFGPKTISTISYNEQEIIRDILHLHAAGADIDCDPTYSIGNFYKRGLAAPEYKFDLYPQVPGVVGARSDNLPLKEKSVNVLMFDPPFIISGINDMCPKERDERHIIPKRFSGFMNFQELKKMYTLSLKEFFRVVAPGGIVIFKCQDVVSACKNHFTHSWLMLKAIELGFMPVDLFILLARTRLKSGKWKTQQHARKYHSYFWVFKKGKCRVEY